MNGEAEDRTQGITAVAPTARRWPWLVGLLLAVVWAAYAGFRLPNLWSVTLYNVAWTDGTVRRALAGTVLGPLWAAVGHRYAVYAAVAFAVLVAVLAVAVIAAMRARWNAQRIVVLVWLLAPTGAYLFHEVGYLDQVVYLLLFASLWLWSRTNPFVAVLPVLASVLVHELVLLTTWPVLAWFAWRAGLTRRSAWALAAPLVTGVALMALPPMLADTVAALTARLTNTLPFPVRESALDLYGRTLAQSWTDYYSPLTGLPAVLAFAAVVALTWLILLVLTRRDEPVHRRQALWALPVCVAPLALLVAGADTWRWVFLAFCNLAIVLYLWLARRPAPPSLPVVAAMVLPFALLLLVPLQYFDGYAPRSPTPEGIARVVEDPDFLRFPVR